MQNGMAITLVKTFEEKITEFTEFSLSTFKEATALSSVNKLIEEVSEVRHYILTQNDLYDLAIEYADCLMCIFDSAARAGITAAQIRTAFERKLEINKSRKWKKQSDNTYRHV